MKNIRWQTIGALMCALAIALGALGAHKIEEMASPRNLEIWKTGALYLFLNGLGILALSSFPRTKSLQRALHFLFWGTLVFSGTLFPLGLRDILPNHNINFLGGITPFGGVAMITGYVMAGLAFRKS